MSTDILSVVIAIVMAILLLAFRHFFLTVGKKRERVSEKLTARSVFSQAAEDKNDSGREDRAGEQSGTATDSAISVEQFLEELRSHTKAERGCTAPGESGSVLKFNAKRRE